MKLLIATCFLGLAIILFAVDLLFIEWWKNKRSNSKMTRK